MASLFFVKNGYHDDGPQYLEDLATAYWYSEVLFTALELDVFSLLASGGMTAKEAASALACPAPGLERFLEALCALGLLCQDDGMFYNSRLAARYLVRGGQDYQGDSVFWRKHLVSSWRGLAEALCRWAGRLPTRVGSASSAEREEKEVCAGHG